MKLVRLLPMFAASLFAFVIATGPANPHAGLAGARDVTAAASLASEVVSWAEESEGEGAAEAERDTKETDEEGKEEEEDEEEEEKEVDCTLVENKQKCEEGQLDVGLGVMLLGGVTFVMGIFVMVNWPDDDVRRYTWVVISNTLGIFLAVLFFQGNKNIIDEFVDRPEHKDRTKLSIALHFVHCCCYQVVLLAIIVFNSGALLGDEDAEALRKKEWVYADSNRWTCGEPVTDEHRNHIRAVKSKNEAEHMTSTLELMTNGKRINITVKQVELNAERRISVNKCFATFMSHCAGFAAITAGGSLQQRSPFKQSAIMATVPIVIIVVFLLLVFQPSQLLRQKVKARASNGGKRAKMLDEFVTEAENDILALAISFLLVQALRQGLTGHLPNLEGLDRPNKNGSLPFLPTTSLAFEMMFCAVAFMLVALLIQKLESKAHAGHGHGHDAANEEKEPWWKNPVEVAQTTCTMCCAWCLFWGLRWMWMAQGAMPGPEEGDFEDGHVFGLDVLSIGARVLVALTVSVAGFFIILPLDKIADAGGEDTVKLVTSIVAGLSLLVGFAWEHSFDGAVSACAEVNKEHPRLTKFILGLMVVGFVIIPWWKYILKKSLALTMMHEETKQPKNIGAHDTESQRALLGAHSPHTSH